MLRSHFTYGGHGIAGVDLEAATLIEAISEAGRGFPAQSNGEWLGGFEIWMGACLLHVTSEPPVSAQPQA
jgi:hypothetical protein